ncbi:unnamed protein product, partial [Phaeothamnion confervicola]
MAMRGVQPPPASGVGPQRRPTYDRPAPSSYVAGLGRGAAGFTTRSDIGPARTPGAAGADKEPDFGPAPAGYVAGRGRGMGDLARSQSEGGAGGGGAGRGRGGGGYGGGGGGGPPGEKEFDYSESNYDEFAGYSERLFGDTAYDHDDEEADRVYEAVDEHMDARRKKRREERAVEVMKKMREERPKISDQFADLKTRLADVTPDQWDAIPEVGDRSLKHKQTKRREVYLPMPDSLIEGARAADSAVSSTAAMDVSITPMTPGVSGGGGAISGLAEARGTVLSLKLDKMSDSVSGQTVVDPKGYLTDLNSLKITSDAEVGDIEKARLLLKSVTSTNPKHGPGWIAAARVEEYAGRLVQARKVIKAGCEACPESEDVWLEAARLQTPENAKVVLANAVRHLPTSVKVWLRAAELEAEAAAKKVVLRRALEFVPNSVQLWRTAIELEEVDDARVMLARAVECVPHSVDMWLALARLESYDNSRALLNEARAALPTEPAIWITAAKLEEAQGGAHAKNVDTIIGKAVPSLQQNRAIVDREQWLQEAEAAERAGAPLTCAAIVRHTVHLGVEAEDRKRTWMDDAEASSARGAVETARAVLAHALSVFPGKKSVWMAACLLEKHHGTAEVLERKLERAVAYCPQAELLWLMRAKERWLSAGDVEGARDVLREAFKANPHAEKIYLAAVKLEWEINAYANARELLSRARANVPTSAVWIKSALLEREVGDAAAALAILDQALAKFPQLDKLYMMAGQASDEAPMRDTARARDYYQRGLRRCPASVPLWGLAARLEERVHGANKARSMLEVARLRNPRTPQLWLWAVRLERRAGNANAAEALVAKALQECPDSGILWAEEILAAPRPQQKSRSVEALRRCDNDPHVITSVARLFAADNKLAKARKWFGRAVTLAPDLGDAWAAYYAFEHRHGTAVEQEDVRRRCEAAEPAHGEQWCQVGKRTENRRLGKGDVLAKVAIECFDVPAA